MSDFYVLSKAECERLGIATSYLNKDVARQKYGETDLTKILGCRGPISWTNDTNPSTLDVLAADQFTQMKSIEVSPLIRTIGIRVALPFTTSIPSNGGMEITNEDGITEVEYGYYPQKAASSEEQKELEDLYKQGKLYKTGNSYTTDSVESDLVTRFIPQTNQEFEYNGKRYIRVRVNSPDRTPYLSNDTYVSNGEFVWIEVLPIKWLVDRTESVMVTKQIILSGIQFSQKIYYRW